MTEVQEKRRDYTPFEKWALAEGVPIVRGYHIPDLYEVKVEPWGRKGGLGAIIILEGGEGFSNACVCELPRGALLQHQKHMFVERIYILKGQGETRVWNDGGKAQTFGWHEYSLFSPPLNTWHQHVNTGKEPARYVAVTSAPIVMNTFRNTEFIFNTPFAFADRYKGEKDYFDGVGSWRDKDHWEGGKIEDVRSLSLPTTVYGKGFGIGQINLSNCVMDGHLSQIEIGTYKKAHRHPAGAHIIIVQGTGYALFWEKDFKDRMRFDFKKGTMYCPPEGWWHLHFNTGHEIVRQVALRRGFDGIGKIYLQRIAIKKGGDMMEYDEEPPELYKEFEAELAKNGLKSAMPPR